MIFDLQGIGMTSKRTRIRLIDRLKESGIQDRRVLQAMSDIPRHIFLDEALAHRAYEDTALPIGHNQTLSQPYIVARMTELLLEDAEPKRVLEVGTGSGYQCAVLAFLVGRVFSVERIEALQAKARLRHKALKLDNVSFKITDGRWGWAEKAPYDAIMVTAAPQQVPGELLQQMAEGGRLVIPVGGGDRQMLKVITKQAGVYDERVVEPVRFVPLVSGLAT